MLRGGKIPRAACKKRKKLAEREREREEKKGR